MLGALGQAALTIGRAGDLAEGYTTHRREKRVDALPRACTRPDDGDAEATGEAIEVDLDLVAPCLIEEVDAEHGLICDLEHLQEEVHIALQAGRIRYDDRHVGS